MSVVWPSSLPVAQRRGYNFVPDDTNERTQGSGLVVKRNRQDLVLVKTKLSWVMSAAQLATFVAWFKYECNAGIAWVTGMTMHDGSKTVRFVDEDPAYTCEELGNFWRVSATVEWEL